MNRSTARQYLNIGLSALGNFVVPWALFHFSKPRFGETNAIYIAAVVPAVWSLVQLAWKRKVDAMTVLALAGIALSLVAVALGGTPKTLLLRDSLITGIIGLVLVGSAVIRRPLFLAMVRAAAGSMNERARDAIEAFAEQPEFRGAMNVASVYCGVLAIVETIVMVALVEKLPSDQFLLVRPFVRYTTAGLIVLFAFVYLMPIARRLEKELA